MSKLALALLAGLALAGSALAADGDADSAKWRKLAATAARYNASTWVRLEAADGRSAWVESHDAAKLMPHRGRPRRVRTLWPDSIEFVTHVGEGTRYMVSDQTWDCSRKAVTEENWFFHANGDLLAERLPEPGEFTDDDLIYQAVCKGLGLKATRRWPSAAAVIANEPDEGLEPSD